MKKNFIKQLCVAALFLAMGLLLPFLTGQIPQIGGMLLPMHLPVLLCGLICGWQYGLGVGLILPYLRFFLFGMPPPFPTGFAMTFELAVYGAVIGLIYMRTKKTVAGVYISLMGAMLAGRIVWGIVRILTSGAAGAPFTWQLFLSGALLEAIPGIILQLIFIPLVMVTLQKTGVIESGKVGISAADARSSN